MDIPFKGIVNVFSRTFFREQFIIDCCLYNNKLFWKMYNNKLFWKIYKFLNEKKKKILKF